jgi:RNA polymerase sigma-70 factor (ECF subfamily)
MERQDGIPARALWTPFDGGGAAVALPIRATVARGHGRSHRRRMTAGDTDDRLLERTAAGDHAAFALLVERHLGATRRAAARILGSMAEAEEVAQEAFLRAWRKAPDWHSGGAAQFPTWLRRVLVNLCIDRQRRPANQPAANLPLDAAAEAPDPAPDALALLARGEVERRVAAAVAALPERQRVALVLCHYEGASNAEAADALDLSVGAVESLLVRARRSLREALADLVDATGEDAATRGESR